MDIRSAHEFTLFSTYGICWGQIALMSATRPPGQGTDFYCMCGADKKGGFETNNSLGEERASRGSKKSELWFCIMKKFKFKLWSPSNLGPNSDSVTSVILA